MRLCAKCGKEGVFYNRPNGKEYSYCPDCQNKYTREHYAENKQYYVDKAIARKKKLYEEVIIVNKNKLCADCGQRFPIVCMDFDHARGVKKFNISSSYYQFSMKKVQEEIAKCDVVCANCHRFRTAQRIIDGRLG